MYRVKARKRSWTSFPLARTPAIHTSAEGSIESREEKVSQNWRVAELTYH